MQELILTPSQQQLLHDQVIDANGPGSILRDFRMLLDLVGSEGVKAAGKHNLLPIEAIPELNQRLSRPLVMNLQRPQLRSHPYLQGLHLLLRASGLGRVTQTGARARLAVDPEVLEAWQRLNFTEQYFTLLEAWLLIGRPEMIGDQRSRMTNFVSDVIHVWRGVPAKGIKRPPEQGGSYAGLGFHLYHAALMDLFGLMAVEHPRQPKQPWGPAGAQHVPFGDAVFTVLGNWYFNVYLLDELGMESGEEGSAGTAHFGRWQALFQAYFPEWRENLVLPEATPREGTFVFRVSLGKIWRRIAIAGDASLDDLALAIVASVKFDEDHLYEFIYRNRFGATEKVCHPACAEGPFTDEVCVAGLPLATEQSMTFLYDFGDEWRFDVQLEQINPSGKRKKSPRILEKHGKSPVQY